MGNQTEDPRRSGQPGDKQRTSQENAGSTEGGGTRNPGSSTGGSGTRNAGNSTESGGSRNAGNSVERLTEKSREGNSVESVTDDRGAGRDPQRAGGQTGQSDKDRDENDTERANPKESGKDKPGSSPR
jgi:hypothetical protein